MFPQFVFGQLVGPKPFPSVVGGSDHNLGFIEQHYAIIQLEPADVPSLGPTMNRLSTDAEACRKWLRFAKPACACVARGTFPGYVVFVTQGCFLHT